MKKRFVAWGAYDDSKPRVRLLLDALRRAGRLEAELHVPVWRDVADKSVAGKGALLRAALRYLSGMPRALWRLMRLPGDAPLLLPYPGTPDIFLASAIARRSGRKLVLDAFLPIYDTIVGDRQMLRDGGLQARFLHAFESAGLRRADVILVDTAAHGDFLSREYAIPADRFVTVPVGAEPLFGTDATLLPIDDLVAPHETSRIVLFYGQFIPLHGLSTILEAVKITQGEAIRWIIVGRGQQDAEMRQFLADGGSEQLTWLPWVEYERLPSLIAGADLCLGIFANSDKAARVIPNKVFQCLAMGKPVITRSSPAIDPIAEKYPQTMFTVPPENPQALVDAVLAAVADMAAGTGALSGLPAGAMKDFSPEAGLAKLLAKLERV